MGSIWILLVRTALHSTPVMAIYMRNAFPQAPTSEKYSIMCGPECGLKNTGKRAIIARDLQRGVLIVLKEISGTIF